MKILILFLLLIPRVSYSQIDSAKTIENMGETTSNLNQLQSVPNSTTEDQQQTYDEERRKLRLENERKSEETKRESTGNERGQGYMPTDT